MKLWEFFHPKQRQLVQALKEGEYEYEQLLFLSQTLETLEQRVNEEGAWFAVLEVTELHPEVAEQFLDQLLEAGYEGVLLHESIHNYTHLILGGWHPYFHLPNYGSRMISYESMGEFGRDFDDFFEATKEHRVYRDDQFYRPEFLNHQLIQTLQMNH